MKQVAHVSADSLCCGIGNRSLAYHTLSNEREKEEKRAVAHSFWHMFLHARTQEMREYSYNKRHSLTVDSLESTLPAERTGEQEQTSEIFDSFS